MKKISTILLTLMLSVSMLMPSFSALPVYADDETPALQTEQSIDVTEEGSADQAENSDLSAEPDAAEEAGQAGTDALETADPADPAAPENGEAADPADAADGAAASEDQAAAETASDQPVTEFGPYDKIRMTDLDDAEKLVISEEYRDKVEITRPEYGNGLLLKGEVGDLNSAYITIDQEFNFDKGSIGRLTLDGLKDKDRGMNVDVEIYLDGSDTPCGAVSLRKQMGKKEWSNNGAQTFSLGSNEISGKHKVSLLLKISGKKDSAKTSVLIRSLQFCKTTIPVMYFNIDESEGTIEAMNNSSDHSVECYGTVDLIVPDTFAADKTFADEYEPQESVTGLELEYIRGRGNSTWGTDKKPYKVKFDKAQDLFGFGKNKHWVLLANRYDNSLIRNRMTYWLGQQLGMEYTPQCVPVEVVMNGEFYGSYLLCEQIRVGKGRVTIDDLDDIKDVPAITDEMIKTGGYLLSMEYLEDKDRSFSTEHGMGLYIESPDDNVKYFSEYIKAYTQKVENAIFGKDFKDTDGHPYTDYLDIDSAVDYWWIQEFSENGDAFGSNSTYLYKKRQSDTDPGKLYWGPLWDFDYVAWGDLDYDSQPSEGISNTSNEWFNRMKSDPEFIKKVCERWNEPGGIREKMVEITKEGGRLDKYIEQMETSYNYDHDLWGPFESEFTEYKPEIEQLRLWINRRIEFVDSAVKDLTISDHNVKFVIDGKVVKEITIQGFLTEEAFPEVPEKAGYVFGNWTDEEDGIYEPGDLVTRDMTLTANYVSENEIVKARDIFFKTYEAYVTVGNGSYYGYNEMEQSALTWYFLDYKVMPEDAWDTKITWSSSDESIAEINEDFDTIIIKDYGDVTITATLENGVSKSCVLHVVNMPEEIPEYEGCKIDKKKMSLKPGEYEQLLATSVHPEAYETNVIFVSTDEKVATVDEFGIVQAVGPGKADILVVDLENNDVHKCSVTVKSNVGRTVKRKGSTYKITSDKKGKRTAMLVKAKNASKVVIPAYIKYDGKKYSVNRIKAKAFAKSKATRVTVKTKKLTKARVKGSLKRSKVRKITVSVGKKYKKKYVKKYKKIFTQKNAGKGVVVK